MDLIKLKNIYICSRKGLVSKINTELLKLNNKKTNNPIKNGQKTWTDTSPNKINIWQVSIWKEAPHPVIRETQIKLDPTPHLSEQPESTTLTAPRAGEDAEQRELASLPLGTQNAAATLEDRLVASHETKQTLTIRFSNPTPWYLPKEAENLCPHKLYTNIYSSCTHSYRNSETTKISFSRWK